MKVTATLIALVAAISSSVEAGAPNDIITRFLADPAAEANNLKQNFHLRSNDGIRRIMEAPNQDGDTARQYLMSIFTGSPHNVNFAVMAPANRRNINSSMIGKYLPKLSDDDMPHLTQPFCEHLSAYLEIFRPRQLARMTDNCRGQALEYIGRNAANVSPIAYKAIPVEWFNTNPNQVYNLGAIDANVISRFNEGLIGAMFSSKSASDYSATLQVYAVDFMANLKSNQTLKISPEAFAVMANVAITPIPNINKFSEDILRFYNRALPQQTLQKVTEKQISHYAEKVDSDVVGENLELTHLDGKRIASVSDEVFYGYFSRQRQLGKLWSHVRPTIFEKAGDRLEAIFANIAEDDLRSMPLSLIDSFDLSRRILSAETLASLNGIIAARYIVKAERLPKDALSYYGVAGIKALTYRTPRGEVSGLDILNMAAFKDRPEAAEIIAQMSTKAADHACASIESSDEFFKNSVIVAHANRACLDALGFEFSESDVKKRATVLSVLPIEQINTIYENDKAKILTAEQVAALSQNPELAKLDESILAVMDKKNMIGFTPAAALIIRQKLTKDIVAYMAPDAFSRFTAADFSGLRFGLADLSKEQLSRVSAEVTESTKSAVTLFSAAEVSRLIPQDMNAQQIALIPGKLISAEFFKALPASSMTLMTANQVAAIPADVLVLITDKQMESIGTQVEPKVSPMSAFKDILSKLTKEARAVYDKRVPAANSASALSVSSLAAVATAAVVVALL